MEIIGLPVNLKNLGALSGVSMGVEHEAAYGVMLQISV